MCYGNAAVRVQGSQSSWCKTENITKASLWVGVSAMISTIVMSILALTGVVSPTALSISFMSSGGVLFLSSIGIRDTGNPSGMPALGIALAALPITFSALLITSVVGITAAASAIFATYGTGIAISIGLAVHH